MNNANGGKGILWGLVQHVPLTCGIVSTEANLYVGEDVPFQLLLQSRTTKARQFYCDQIAGRNGLIFVGSSLALKKELIAHFSEFLANCLGCRQIFEGKKM